MWVSVPIFLVLGLFKGYPVKFDAFFGRKKDVEGFWIKAPQDDFRRNALCAREMHPRL